MTHNTREGIEERFWKMMEQNQFVKSTNSVTDKVEEYPPAIVDMEATVAINGEFDKYAIDEWLHQELQKAREEEREKALRDCKLDGFEIREIVQGTIGEQYQKRFNKNLDYDQWAGIRDEMDVCTRKIAEKINERVELNNQALQSELDQPIS